MPTVLRRGQVAIISYEADTTGAAAGDNDALRVVLLAPVTVGTTIFVTDRNWNGTAFAAAGGGDGTLTITAPAGGYAAGTVLTFTRAQLTAAGITHSNGGDTLYVYQGTINAPTTFLHAVDYGDGNTTFNGSLVNTGLVNGVSAVAVAHDNASWAGSATQVHQSMFLSINNTAHWHGSDLDDTGATANYSEVFITHVGNPGDAFPESNNDTYLNAMDMVMIAGMAGGGQSDSILRVGNDEGANIGSNLTRMFRDNPAFNRIYDVTFDIQDGFFFFVDSNGNATNRIMRGNIADLVSGNNNPTFTQVFATDGFGEIMTGIEINTATNHIYWWDGDLSGNFEGGWQLLRSNYDGTGLTQIALLDDENPDPTFGIPGGIGDWALDIPRGFAYVTSSTSVVDGLGNASVTTNHILRVTLATGVINVLVLDNADPRTSTGGGIYNNGRLDPLEGQIMALDVDTNTGIIYFITQPIGPNNNGGVWSYNPATDDLVEIWNQPSNNAHNTLQSFPTANMTHIEVDEIGGRIYISSTSDTDTEVDGNAATNESDAAIFSLAIGAAPGTAPTLFVRAFEPTANGAPQGMEIDYAPTVTNLVSANATYTESTNLPGSPAGPAVQVGGAPTIADPDNTLIQSATVAITGGFVAGDVLGFTNSGGITGSYNAATGIITFTGAASFAAYQTVMDSITFTNAGDNPTNYGEATSRTISFTVFDGLAYSDPATVNVTVVGINDIPVNAIGTPAFVFTEDAVGSFGTPTTGPTTAISGIQISDVDADPDTDPVTQNMTVTLSVTVGTLNIRTDVANGITAVQVSGNGTGTITINATQNQINTTLAAMSALIPVGPGVPVPIPAAPNGLVYTTVLDYYGPATLTVTTNDNGFNGNDPGLSGTGTSEQDSDTIAITINPVVDIANDTVNIAEDAGTQNLNLLANDTFENSNRSITAVGSATHGTVVINDNGTPGVTTDDFVQYTANADYNGADSFTYTVTSGGVTEQATVNVNISAVVDIANDVLNFAEDAGAQTLDVLANDSFENSNRAITSVTQGAHGTVTINDNGTPGLLTDDYIVYTQVADYNGTDSFNYTVTSGGVTETATVNVTISAVVDIAADSVTVDEDSGANNLNLLGNDTFENIGRSITAVGSATNGVVTINNNGTAGDTSDDFVVYTPNANYNGSDSFTYTVTSGGVTEQSTANVTVTAVNDPVTGAAPLTASLNEDSANVAIAGMSIADVDTTLAPAGVYDVTLTSTDGTLTLTTTTGLTFSTGDGTGDSTMTFHGTRADINAALATAQYTPTPNFSGPATITLNVTDTFGGIVATGTGAATNDTDVINVTVNEVNDEPAGADKTIGIDEDETYVLVAADFGFTDPIDSDALLEVVLTTLPNNGDLYLNNVLITVAGTAVSATDIGNNLLTFKPDANQSGTNYATFTFQVRDDGGTLNGGVNTDQSANTITFDVADLNDAPIHTVPLATQTFNEDNTLTFNAANSNLISVSDVDAGSADVQTTLAIQTGTLTLNAGAIAALTSVTGNGTNNVVLTGTVAEINAALDGLVYNPGANYNGDRNLTITTNDLGNAGADPGLTGTATSEEDQDVIAVDVTSVNDAPVVIGDGTEEADEIVEDTPGPGETVSSLFGGQYSDSADAQFSVSNPGGSSSGSFSGVAVVANGSSGATGQWQYFDTDLSDWVDIGPRSASDALLIGSGTLVRFNPALDFFGAAPTLTVHLIDNSLGFGIDFGQEVDISGVGATGGSTAYSTGTVVLSQNVVAANAPPVVDLDANDSSTATGGDYLAAGYTENGAAVAIADADVTITDADSGAGDMVEGATISVSDAVAGDGLTLSGALPSGITVLSGLGTDTLVLTGTASAADYQTALTLVRYSSSSEDPTVGGTDGQRSVTVTVTDGTSNSVARTATVNITAANDAPAGTDNTVTASEDVPLALHTANFDFTDPDSGDAIGGVIITGVTGGKLFFDSDGAGGTDPVEVTSFPTAEYSAADVDDGKLTFLANPNVNGTGVGTIGFQVVDNSGAVNNTDLSANTLTIDVTPINDSPVVPNSPGIAVAEQTTITINPTITVSDADLDALNGGAGDYEGASFVINRDVSNADDLFNFDVTGALFTVNGNDLESGGNVFATFTQSGGILNISFTSSETAATTALVNDVLRHLQYTNLSNDPPASVTLLYGLDDGAPDAVQGALGAPFNNFDGGQVVVTLNAVNDAPVNSLGGTIGTGEDAVDAWLSGMSISDPDADPATDKIFVNFFVDNGSLEIRTDVVGGIEAGDIIAQSSETISVLATQDQINATLAASNGLTYTPDLNFNGDDTLTVTTNDMGFTGSDPGLSGDGTSEADVDTRTISVSAVEDPADAVDDSGSIDENDAIINGNVTANDTDPDGPTPTVTHVNGVAASVGNQITLPSGALLELRADGTYDYDPNGAFNWLTDNVSGAVNTSAEDTFTYTLANGDTATVTITVNGVATNDDLLFGDATNNVINGTNAVGGADGTDTFNMQHGGDDTVNGNGANDIFYFGASLTSADSVNGGLGTDTLALLGDYNLTLGSGQLTGVERLVLYSGDLLAGPHVDYTLTMTDSAVAAGNLLTVFAPNLASDEQLIFNGIAETNGRFWIQSGAGNDILAGGDKADSLYGGAGNDQLYGRGDDDFLVGGLGADQLRGGLGHDRFYYESVAQSTAASTDTIQDFQTIDRIDLSAIDANGNAGDGDTEFTFIGSNAFTNVAGQLRATESGGVWTVEGDTNGDGTADLVITVNTVEPEPLTGADFFL